MNANRLWADGREVHISKLVLRLQDLECTEQNGAKAKRIEAGTNLTHAGNTCLEVFALPWRWIDAFEMPGLSLPE